MIPFFDYRPTYQAFGKEIDAAMRRVLESGRLILGPEVKAFEREFADYVGVPHAVGVNSGTDALILALRAIDVGPGDEVITVANSGVPPVAAVRAAGALPRFVDVDPGTLLLDPAGLEGALTSRTRCILVVHLYGQPAAMDAILRFATRHELKVIEDCAQAHGARYRGAHVGALGDVGCFSFYPTKNLGAYGDAGLCVTRDGRLEQRIRMMRMYGFRQDRHAHCEGLNSRLDELQAAVLRVQLRHLESALDSRRRLAARYGEALSGSGHRPVAVSADGSHAYHLFVVQTLDRPRLTGALTRESIGFGIHYEEPVHLMEAYRFLGYRQGALPVTEQACRSVVSLPLYPGLPDWAVDRVLRALPR